MQFARIAVAAAIGIGCCSAASAAQRDDARWVEAQSLRELPAGVQVLLGAGLAPDEGGIADRDGRFNPSDIMIDGVPGRRFALGVLKGDTALVAVEQGGRGYSVQTMEFKQAGSTWAASRCVSSATLPQHGADLVDTLAHPAPNVTACIVPGAPPGR
ncbi:hypothetical protein [Massilia sp. 9096]|uniref:hypothetical protein n=1 Tax=Massilia sp. 9096 TaxID=1500894 RepID=UPI00055B7AC9|nr:hypothetical protein [Massilia sp. 9096]